MKIQDYCDTNNGVLQLRIPLQSFSWGNIVTDDAHMKRQLEMLQRVSQGRAPLTIRGEKGSGKDRIAQYAHDISTRHKVPLVKTNCAYLSEEQLYVKLFGPAANRELGLIHRAAGGSLYLENADRMSEYLQYQLMRYIRENASDDKTPRFMICMQDRDAQEHKLSEDMAYYFGAMVFDILPLRERPQDILLLAFQQLQIIRQEYRLERTLSPEIMSAMLTYEWPGNIRQLSHTIERMAILSDSTRIDSVHLLQRCLNPHQQLQTRAASAAKLPESRSLKRIVQDYEFLVIQQSIEQHGSIRKAAAALKTSHATLSRKITEYNLLAKDAPRE